MSPTFLSIVIPAYNEERRISSTLDSVTDYLSEQPYTWEIVVANDGSVDSTPALVSSYEGRYPNVRLLSLPHRGKGGAVQAGMLHANGEYRVLCDADLSMPIEHIQKFLSPGLSDFDIAVGSREATGAHRFDEPRIRHLSGRAFNLAVRALLVPDIQDTQCGFKCFRGPVADKIFPMLRVFGFGFDVEVLFLAQRLHFRTVEVPIDWYHDSDSTVRPFWDGVGMAGDVLRIRWNAWRGKYADSGVSVPLAE